MNYYPHHIGDFDRATRHLTRIERSVYRDLIERYYYKEQQLTLDLADLCRKICARSNEESTAVEQTLNEFFVKTATGWYHERCEVEIEKYRSNSSQKAQAGKASAEARKLKRLHALNGDSTAVERTLNGDSTNREPGTGNRKPLTENQSSITTDVVITPIEVINPKPLKDKTAVLIKTTVAETELQSACRETWKLYSEAYLCRYGANPLRNTQVNSKIKQFVQRVGGEESPFVATFYVSHNSSYYVRQMHAVGPMLADAEKLRTEWVTGRRMTHNEAKSAEQIDSVKEQISRVGKLLEASNDKIT